MGLFSETRVRTSEKNGTIIAKRIGTSWQVTVDECEQTGPLVHEMWLYALRMLSDYLGLQRVRRVLLLGLGAGGEVKNYYQRFPNAEITIIEYDPEMIALARELGLYRPYSLPHVICEDARVAVPALSGTFDVIVIDLFKGPDPSPLSEDRSFLESVNAKLSHSGYIVANVYWKKEILESLSAFFTPVRSWRFRFNHLGIFSKKTVADAFREGYRPVRNWPEINRIASIPSAFNPAQVGEKSAGIYWRIWPFSFEQYGGDTEPAILPLPAGLRMPFRVIMWRRTLRPDIPEGWFAFSERPSFKIGFTPLTPEYTKRWSESAKRALKAWRALSGVKYRIEEIEREEFGRSLKKSTLPLTMRDSVFWEIDLRGKNPLTPVRLFGVRRISDGKLVAGMARMYSSVSPISYYMNGFYLKEVAEDPLMMGLFDDWFSDALKKGIRFLDFGTFYKAGDDGAWKGFSVFKAKFNPLYFFLPPVLYKFRWGRK